jgi:hypothetical protein
MANISAVDTMIFQHNDLWWMFTNFDPTAGHDSCVELNIFWSHDPTSTDWHPHAMNPVIVDSTRARNGGIIFEGGEIFRVAQAQGFALYGKSMQVLKITELTKNAFEELPVQSFDHKLLGAKHGVHHLNANGSYSVFDGQ